MDIEKMKEINRKQVFETGNEKQFIRAKDIEWLFEQIYQQNEEIQQLKGFYNYFSELYGKGLEVANWHENGDLEPFDEFFNSAEEEMS